jgi:hypothetical protein
MMTQRKQLQLSGWDSPRFLIDCVLTNVTGQLEADGCVLERLETGCKPATPDYLRAGDFVTVQLWLEGEETFVDIRLAEVRTVHEHWIAVEVIQVSPHDRMRLKRLIDAPTGIYNIKEAALINHLLIRA